MEPMHIGSRSEPLMFEAGDLNFIYMGDSSMRAFLTLL